MVSLILVELARPIGGCFFGQAAREVFEVVPIIFRQRRQVFGRRRAGFAVADVPEHLMLRVRDDCGAPQLATCFYRYLAFLVPVAVKR